MLSWLDGLGGRAGGASQIVKMGSMFVYSGSSRGVVSLSVS